MTKKVAADELTAVPSNTEILKVRDGKIVEVEVYFGWSVPHEVPAGEHRDLPMAN